MNETNDLLKYNEFRKKQQQQHNITSIQCGTHKKLEQRQQNIKIISSTYLPNYVIYYLQDVDNKDDKADMPRKPLYLPPAHHKIDQSFGTSPTPLQFSSTITAGRTN